MIDQQVVRAEAPREVRRILISAGWFGALVALGGWIYGGGAWALGFACGALLGALNLVLLTALVQEIVRLGRRHAGRIAALLAVKMPLVYGGLAALLLWKRLPSLAVVCGFSLVLAVIVLRAAGRAVQATGIFSPPGPAD